jgi:excisionase family DNA binding protein
MLLTIREACERLKISPETLRRLRREGQVREVNLCPNGGRPTIRVDLSPLLEGDGERERLLADVRGRMGR